MPKLSFADVRLNYDPSAPQQRFREAGLEAAFANPSAQLPKAPPWPADGAPQPIALTPPPAETNNLPDLKVTMRLWLRGRPRRPPRLAALLTPAHPTSTWYEYRHKA